MSGFMSATSTRKSRSWRRSAANSPASTVRRWARVAFVSLDGERHHSLALFEDGERLASGNSKTEPTGVHHIALPAASVAEVKAWEARLEAAGIEIDGPYVQGPEGGGLDGGSGSYAIFFNDPNGICFEIYAGAMTLGEFRRAGAAKAGADAK